MQKEKGFTLIELMVTVAVMVIVASVAAPSMIGFFKTHKLNQAKEQMIQALKEGRSRAAATRALVIVCPSKIKDGDSISIDKCLTSAGVASSDSSVFKDSNRVILANLASGITVSGDANFVFGPTGASLQNASNAVPKAKSIVICSDTKSKEIEVSLLGSVGLKSSGSC